MQFQDERFNPLAKTGAKIFPSVFCVIALASIFLGCSDFMHPVESTPAPTEYEYNYWLLERTYLYESDLESKDPSGDDVQKLYANLSDRFTRYISPSNSESASTQINTSIVPGDIGLEYAYNSQSKHPLIVYRVYAESPAGRVGVPRYGSIFSINEVELHSDSFPSINELYSKYKDVLNTNKEIHLTILYGEDTLSFTMEKEDVYAPTVFVDTLYNTIVVTISEFKQTTVDKVNGSYGELKAYLDSTRNVTSPRLLNLAGNPGGHVSQCTAMADLFISSGNVSTRSWRTFDADGKSIRQKRTVVAKSGDAGEDLPFALLVNGNSASCAEIFTIAVAEGANFPVIGDTTYGKGIGQTTWTTPSKGLAIITNLEFLSPKGNSYHLKGIAPQYLCDGSVTTSCGVEWTQKIFGTETSLAKQSSNFAEIIPLDRGKPVLAGAFIEGN